MLPIAPEARFTRVPGFEARAAGLQLAPEVWSVFSLLEQAADAREIAAALLSPVPAVLQALDALREAGLIQAQAIGWTEFAKRPKSPVPAATRAPGDAVVSIRIVPAIPRAPALVSFRLGEARAAVAPAVWKLRPALDAIAATAGGGVPGQLLVYKLFLLIPPDLLKASGIESVNAIGPDFQFTDPRLRDTLIGIAREHVSLDLAPHFAV